MRHHGGGHGREIAQRRGVVKLYHPVDRRAGGGDEILEPSRGEQSRVLVGHRLGAHRRLLDEGEAQGIEGGFDLFGVVYAQPGHEGGGEADDHGTGLSRGEQFEHRVRLAVHLLCVLRADMRAVTAEDALLLDYLCLMVLVAYGFDGTLAQAAEAVLALGVFEIQIDGA